MLGFGPPQNPSCVEMTDHHPDLGTLQRVFALRRAWTTYHFSGGNTYHCGRLRQRTQDRSLDRHLYRRPTVDSNYIHGTNRE